MTTAREESSYADAHGKGGGYQMMEARWMVDRTGGDPAPPSNVLFPWQRVGCMAGLELSERLGNNLFFTIEASLCNWETWLEVDG
jgi:hypothetical protein